MGFGGSTPRTPGPRETFDAQRDFINDILQQQRDTPETAGFLENQRILSEQARAGVSGDISALPPDFQRNLEQDVRSSQTSRGIAISTPGAVQEAGVLAGGRENIRARRLQQLQSVQSSFSLPLLGLAPTSRDIAAIGGQQFNQQVAGDRARGQAFGQIGSLAGSLIGAGVGGPAGFAVGGAIGGAAGSALAGAF